MIEDVVYTDLCRRQLEAVCRYSRKTHLWLEDHAPGRTLKHPLVSGVIALETLMEASRLLCPQFEVRGARDGDSTPRFPREASYTIEPANQWRRRNLHDEKGSVVCDCLVG